MTLRRKPITRLLLDGGTKKLLPGPVGWCALFYVAAASDDRGPLAFGLGPQVLGGPGLPDARFPYQHDQPALSGEGIFQRRPQLTHLPLATYDCSPPPTEDRAISEATTSGVVTQAISVAPTRAVI